MLTLTSLAPQNVDRDKTPLKFKGDRSYCSKGGGEQEDFAPALDSCMSTYYTKNLEAVSLPITFQTRPDLPGA